MTRSTYYPTTLTDEVAAQTQRVFAEMTAPDPTRAAAAATSEKPAPAPKRFITVVVRMPHVSRYGKDPVMELTYGCTFDARVGDVVLCPPTRLHDRWTKGVVKDLEGTGYRGRVKYVKALGSPNKTSAKKKG